jgi:hypothetical protein
MTTTASISTPTTTTTPIARARASSKARAVRGGRVVRRCGGHPSSSRDVETETEIAVAVEARAAAAVPPPSRREILSAAAAGLLATSSAIAAEDEEGVFVVAPPGAPSSSSSSSSYPTIAAAVDAARASSLSTATIRLAPGTYPERVVIPPASSKNPTQALAIESAEGVGSTPGIGDEQAIAAAQRCVVEHVTDDPYEATFEVAEDVVGGVFLRNITVRHSSPSVANNYAVFARPRSALRLDGCDVSSATGSGVVGEGADVTVAGCYIHDVKTHGVALYGDLLGEFGGGRVLGTLIARPGRDGVLIRDGAAGVVDQCEIADAGAFGVELVDPREGSEVTGCVIRGSKNKAGIGFGGVGAEDNVLVKGNKVTR